MVTSTADPERNLTIVTCAGQITAKEIMETIESFYANSPSLSVMWDFTEADLSRLTADEVRMVASDVKRLAHSREGGKTAIVSPSELSYGMVRMYQAFAEIYEQTAVVEAFRSRLEADRWINEK